MTNALHGYIYLDTTLTPEERAQLIEDKIWIKDCIGILDEKLGPYMNFHSI